MIIVFDGFVYGWRPYRLTFHEFEKHRVQNVRQRMTTNTIIQLQKWRYNLCSIDPR